CGSIWGVKRGITMPAGELSSQAPWHLRFRPCGRALAKACLHFALEPWDVGRRRVILGSARRGSERRLRSLQDTDLLTSSIVPRGTSFHRSVELECSGQSSLPRL